MIETDSRKIVRILYQNYRGEVAVRRIFPKEISFGATQWHSEEQWLLLAYDLDKAQDRTFAIKDIRAWWSDEDGQG